MKFDANKSRSRCYWHALSISALLLTACSGASDTELTQSTDALKGGIPANGKTKEKTNSGMQAQAGSSAHGRPDEDGGVKDNNGKNQGRAGSESKGKGHAEAGSHAMGKADTGDHEKGPKAEAGSHAKGPKAEAGSQAKGPKAAGHGADDDDANEDADETP